MTTARTKPETRRWMLILGDVAALIVVTLLGFYSHNEIAPQSAVRMLATFVPFTLAWLLVAPWLGLYDPSRVGDARRAWLPALAAVYAAPLGAVLRGIWLGAPVLPVFVGVMAGVMAVGLTAWRAVYLVVARR